MKKSIFTLAFLCAALAGMTFTSCSKNNDNEGGGNAPSYPEAPGLACIKINGIWWAPVNCGYDSTGYKYGKLYQWGRRNGCGYGATWTEGGTEKGPETVIQTTMSGPVSTSGEDAAIFYVGTGDWLTPQDDTRWNSGTETSPKTQYDPCPTGWRVPTDEELTSLIGSQTSGNLQDGTGVHAGMKGMWFDGSSGMQGSGIFLPAAGISHFIDGSAVGRGSNGVYWSSSVDVHFHHARDLSFSDGNASMGSSGRAYGYSVRCVQE